jgi:hypothetical protein
LWHVGRKASPCPRIEAREIVLADSNASGRRLREAHEKGQQRGLPGAARADERNCLPRLDDELGVAKHVDLTCRVPERDTLEHDRRERRYRHLPRLDGDGGSIRQVEQSLRDGCAVGARVPL